MSWQAQMRADARYLDETRVSLHPELDRDWSPAARRAAALAAVDAIDALRPYLGGDARDAATLDDAVCIAAVIAAEALPPQMTIEVVEDAQGNKLALLGTTADGGC